MCRFSEEDRLLIGTKSQRSIWGAARDRTRDIRTRFTKTRKWRRSIGAVVLGTGLGLIASTCAYWSFANRSKSNGTYDVVRSAVAFAVVKRKLNQNSTERAELAHLLAQDDTALTQASVGAALKKLTLEEDANRTDRYTQAVEQLGSESIHIRLGGIYALKPLADDSERDLPTVVEVLAAFIRATTAVLPSGER